MTTGKTIALTRWTFVGKVMSLFFNMLSRLVAGRSYPTSEARGGGWEDLPHVQGQGQWPEGATPPPRSSGYVGARRALWNYSTFKVRRGGSEEIPLIQGKEQWLHFAGAAVKRYPTPKVRETQVRR